MAEKDAKVKLTNNDLDIGDYMDIVTTYKCRFCDFTSSYPQGIGKHVREVHVTAPVVVMPIDQPPSTYQEQDNQCDLKQTTILDEESQRCQNADTYISSSKEVDEDNETTSGSMTTNRTSENIADMLESIQEKNLDKPVCVTSFTEIPCNIAVSSSSQAAGITTETINLSSTGDTQILTLPLDSQCNIGSGDLNQNASDNVQNFQQILQVITKPDAVMVDSGQQCDDDTCILPTSTESDFLTGVSTPQPQRGNVTSAAIPSAGDSSSSNSTSSGQTEEMVLSSVSVDMSANQDDGASSSMLLQGETFAVTEGSEGNTPMTTRELFVCGQCNCGFNTIEDCHTHMMDEHKFEMQEDIGSNKVSVGTQVEGKKRPGRKKKSEIISSCTNNEEDPDYEIKDSDLDSDWEEEEYTPRPSRTRRKIKPPKALQEDYFMGKKRKRELSPPETEFVEKTQPKYRLKCNEVGCHAKFNTDEALDVHLKCHIKDAFTFQCYLCQETHNVWKSLRFHLWKEHQIDTDLLTCDVCQTFKSDTMSKMLVHKEIHGTDKPYMCDVCGKGFKQFTQMRNHQVIHESKQTGSNKWYCAQQCQICCRTFANKKCLMKHIEGVHGKMKPFVCPYCGHATSRKAMMELHIRTHTGDKPFKCDQCSYVSGDHNSLRRHKMRHTGQKPYKCQFCNYSCIQSISIKMHMKNKHPGISAGVFCCDICTFRTVREEFFRNHMMDHQNGLIPDHHPTPTSSLKQLVIQGPPSQRQIQVVSQEEHMKLDQLVQNHLQEQGQQNSGEIIEIQALKTIPGTDLVATGDSSGQLQLQIQTLESGETQISSDDLSRLNEYEGMFNSEMSAAQLVITALNAISQKKDDDDTPQIINGIQTSITSSNTKDGITNHTITFHLPTLPTMTENAFYLIQGSEVEKVDSDSATEVQQLVSVPLETIFINEGGVNLEETEIMKTDSIVVNTTCTVSE